MDSHSAGRTALVLGGSKGLGKACAFALGSAGCDIVICARSPETTAEAAADLERTLGREVRWYALDVGDAASSRILFDAIETGGMRVDILVQNAGGPPVGGFDDFDESVWREMIERHFLAGIRFYRAVLPGMRERRWGRIVNIASRQIKEPRPDNILSGAARLGLMGMAKALSRTVARDGITINTVCPGQHETERLHDLAAQRAAHQGTTTEAVLATLLRDVPAGRPGKPEDFGRYVAFLCSDAGSFINGTTIAIDGGAGTSLF